MHREIAGIFKSDDIQGLLRYHGAVSAIRDAGLPIRDGRFAWYDTEDRRRLLEEQDRQPLTDFLQKRLGDATAVICYNDEIAYRLIQVLLEAGRRVPEEVSVVSFDNSYLSQLGPVAAAVVVIRHTGNLLQSGVGAVEKDDGGSRL